MRKETGWKQTGEGLVSGDYVQDLLGSLLWFQHLPSRPGRKIDVNMESIPQ